MLLNQLYLKMYDIQSCVHSHASGLPYNYGRTWRWRFYLAKPFPDDSIAVYKQVTLDPQL